MRGSTGCGFCHGIWQQYFLLEIVPSQPVFLFKELIISTVKWDHEKFKQLAKYELPNQITGKAVHLLKIIMLSLR